MNLPVDESDMVSEFVDSLNAQYGDANPEDILELALAWSPGAIAFANSFGLEDLVIQHMLLKDADQVETFVLDTGRLPSETYDLIERWRIRFGLKFRLMYPRPELLEPFIESHGPNPFYESIALRKNCCAIRKLEPLQRALVGKKAWITGLRREQSQTRSELSVFELEASRRLKISPLANWSLDDVWAYVKKHDLPYNALHDRGYPSLGCAPCTRAIAPGENIRAGRWWWESDGHRECGLHFSENRIQDNFNANSNLIPQEEGPHAS